MPELRYRPRVAIQRPKNQIIEVMPDDEGVLVLYERHHSELYLDGLVLDAIAPRARLNELELSWNSSRCCFELPVDVIAFWVGEATLTVHAGDGERTHEVRVEPHPDKARMRDWMLMLRQLEDWLAGVTAGHEGGHLGTVSSRGQWSAPYLAEALIPLVPALAEAWREVSVRPHRRTLEQPCEVPLRAASRIDGETLRWTARHGDAAQWLTAEEISGREPMVLQREPIADLDHPANRYVRWLVAAALQRLDDLHRELVRLAHEYGKKKTLNDTAGWCRARAQILAGYIDELRRVWRASPLRALRPEPAASAADGVLVDHPSYARIVQIGQRILSPRFALAPDTGDTPDPDDHDAAATVRPSYDLYELWTFLLVQQSLQRVLPAGWTWDQADLSTLRTPEDTGEGAYMAARGPGGQIVEVRFNHSFRALGKAAMERALRSPEGLAALPDRYSLSTGRRPDIVVSLRRHAGEGAWVCLDAKYYQADQLSSAMEKLHIYCDSLWMRDCGGRCRGALLLAPSCGSRPWALPGFRERFDIGVWECPPGMEPDAELGAWIARRLGASV
jgi:hypothetical protein